MKHLYEAMLLTVPGIGEMRLKKLQEQFGDAETAWKAQRQDLFEADCLGNKEIDALLELREHLDCTETEKAWITKGIRICSIADQEYPELLRKVYAPPPYLFYRGCLQGDAFCLAVVGSRRSTPYGRNVARSFSEKLSKGGVTIVSGAAKGIDTAAHEGALDAGALTTAVLGCGVDVVYPAENARLLEKIAAQGCIISEYPPGTQPTPGRFPARNRIVAGMSTGVLVVEAALKSGALITADLALGENRDVYAIPGSVFSEASRGTNRLIQQGAMLINSPDELLEEMGFAVPVQDQPANIILSAKECHILQVLDQEKALPVDSMVMQLGMEASQLLVILLQLEMAGYVVKDPSMGFRRSAKE